MEDTSLFRESDLRNPRYQRIKPTWSFDISLSGSALGGSSFSSGGFSNTVRGFLLDVQYEPAFLQKIGVISFGPTGAYYPVFPRYNNVLPLGGVWSVGVEARYQAVLFKNQPLVPYVGLASEMINYHLASAPGEHLIATGPILGLGFLLNWLEPSSAFDFYSNYGAVRSYLTAELRSLSGSSSDQTISGSSYFFGLRIEF
jgi:hypothetical protein